MQGALLTGCRYGELVSLQARDFNADAGTLAILTSKSGRSRHVVLTEEGQRFFTQATAGKDGASLIFTRSLQEQAGWAVGDFVRRPRTFAQLDLSCPSSEHLAQVAA